MAVLPSSEKQGKYYSLLYILEDVFERDDRDLLRGKIGDVLFYKLYLAYGFGVANQSRIKSGKDVFAQIRLETNGNLNMEVQLTCMEATFELINSSYEWLDYKQAEKYIDELHLLIAKLQMFGYLDKDIKRCEKYILSCSIKMLMLSEQNRPEAEVEHQKLDSIANAYHYDYEALFFKLRYVETLYFRNTDAAFHMVCACMDGLKALRGVEEKFYLWAKMDSHFLDMILHDKSELIREVMNDHQELKRHCYNDYRKRLFVLASYFYSYGMMDEGNRYFFSDIVVARDLRPRQKAFYYETLALYEAINNNMDAALSALQEASKLFVELPTYLEIIRHNYKLIESGQFKKSNIRFCCNDVLGAGTYCLDPRCIW